jgi:hypothetical protein
VSVDITAHTLSIDIPTIRLRKSNDVHWNGCEVRKRNKTSDSVKEISWTGASQPSIDVIGESEREQTLDNLGNGNGFSGFVAIAIDDVCDDSRSNQLKSKILKTLRLVSIEGMIPILQRQ